MDTESRLASLEARMLFVQSEQSLMGERFIAFTDRSDERHDERKGRMREMNDRIDNLGEKIERSTEAIQNTLVEELRAQRVAQAAKDAAQIESETALAISKNQAIADVFRDPKTLVFLGVIIIAVVAPQALPLVIGFFGGVE